MSTSTVEFPAILPKAAVDTLKKAIAKKRFHFVDLDPAFTAVDFPRGVLPVASRLTPSQRALAEVLTAVLGEEAIMVLPDTEAVRRRWLGLEPPGALEEEVLVTTGGVARREPMWRALVLLKEADDEDETAAFIASLSLVQRMRLWTEIRSTRLYASYGIMSDIVFDPDHDLALLRTLDGDEARAWAIDAANAATAPGARVALEDDRIVIFTALLQLKVPIEARWAALVPVLLNDKTKLTTNAIKALPLEHRAAAAVDGLKILHPAWAISAFDYLVHAVPDPALARQVLSRIDDVSGSRKQIIAAVRASAKKYPAILAAIDAFEKGEPAAVSLTTVSLTSPSTLAALSPIDQKQVLAAGKLYHGKKVTLEQLLDDDPHSELTFAGGLERRALADAAGKLVYDVWEYRGDTGCIFKAGTTTVVAEVLQGSVECNDAGLREGLEQALRQKPSSTSKKTTAKKTTAKKTAKKKTTKKKTAKKKTAAKKTVTKKTATKKTPARK